MNDYQRGYDDAKGEKHVCKGHKLFQAFKKTVADHCIELIEFLESIDGVIVVETDGPENRATTTIEAGALIKALKELRKDAEDGIRSR